MKSKLPRSTHSKPYNVSKPYNYPETETNLTYQCCGAGKDWPAFITDKKITRNVWRKWQFVCSWDSFRKRLGKSLGRQRVKPRDGLRSCLMWVTWVLAGREGLWNCRDCWWYCDLEWWLTPYNILFSFIHWLQYKEPQTVLLSRQYFTFDYLLVICLQCQHILLWLAEPLCLHSF